MNLFNYMSLIWFIDIVMIICCTAQPLVRAEHTQSCWDQTCNSAFPTIFVQDLTTLASIKSDWQLSGQCCQTSLKVILLTRLILTRSLGAYHVWCVYTIWTVYNNKLSWTHILFTMNAQSYVDITWWCIVNRWGFKPSAFRKCTEWNLLNNV